MISSWDDFPVHQTAEPVRFVLELNAGITAELFIDENSRLLWSPASDSGQ